MRHPLRRGIPVTLALLAALHVPSPGEGQVARIVAEVGDTPVEADGPAHPLAEPRPAVHPKNPRIMAIGVIVRGAEGDPWYCAALYSDDGGRSWSRNDFTDMERCIDPWVEILPDGTVLFTGIEIRADAEGDDRFVLRLHRSSDGRSWTPATELGRTHEHAMLAVSGPDGSPVVHLVSRVTTDSPEGGRRHGVHVARSDDSGESFYETFRLLPGTRSVIPTGVVPLPAGGVAVSYRGSNRNMANDEEGDAPAARSWLVGVDAEGRPTHHALIHDGCSTGALEQAFPGYPFMAGSGGAGGDAEDVGDAGTGARSPGAGPALHHACIRPGLEGVDVSSSTDGGATWGGAVRVDEIGGSGSPHARTPMVAVNEAGVVAVAWYDRRNDPEGACQDVYLTASADGGRTFVEPIRVTTETSCPGVDGNGVVGRSWAAGGDYSSMVAGPDGRFHLVWADARSGRFELRRAVYRVDGS